MKPKLKNNNRSAVQNMQINKGKLFLIPTALNPNQIEFLLPTEKIKIKHIKTFAVENPKNARANLKKLQLEEEIQNLKFLILDEHTKEPELEEIIKPILNGEDVGLLSEAGIPAVADPGSSLIKLAHKHNIEVIPLVGPSSIILSLMSSGLNGQNFAFLGYLPIKKDDRVKALKSNESISHKLKQTQIFIEAPYRNLNLWSDMLKHLDPRTYVSISINLTAPDQYIKTATVLQWRKMKWPKLDKVPAIFLINASNR